MSATTQEHAGSVELNGINVIREDERGGKPRQLFWPWFAANISVAAISVTNGINVTNPSRGSCSGHGSRRTSPC